MTAPTISGAGPFSATFEISQDGTLPAARTILRATITSSGTTGDLLPAAVAQYVPTDILAPVQGAD